MSDGGIWGIVGALGFVALYIRLIISCFRIEKYSKSASESLAKMEERGRINDAAMQMSRPAAAGYLGLGR